MEIEDLRLFVEVAQRGNFATVARDHDKDPSSVSRAMAMLEENLGVRLFQRSTRHVTLTEAGELYLSRISQILEDIASTHDEIRHISAGPAGMLRLTASVAFGNTCLIPMVPAFQQAYPNIKLELILTDNVLDLITDRVDLAIRLGNTTSNDYVTTKLFDSRYRVCASPEYLKSHSRPATPNDLQKHNCLLFALPEFRTRWLFRDSHGHVEEVPVHGNITILNAQALRNCALMGMGPVMLADWLIDDDIKHQRLIDLFPEHRITATEFDTAVWLLYPSKSYLPAKVRVMIEFLKLHLGQKKISRE